MINVLVTGGAGYIGSHCCKELHNKGYNPITFDNLVYGHRENVNILIAHQGVPLPDWFIKTVEKSNSNIKWFLRLHPGTDIATYSGSDISNLSRCENVEISHATTLPVLALLEKMSIHVTQWSSTVMEAKVIGIPTIIIHEYGKYFYSH